MLPAKGYAAHSAQEPLKPFSFERRDPKPTDVQIEILFCGVCHSDLHIARNEWGGTTYPCVPGHEIAGRVVKVGREVKKFKEGDLAAVGCMVDSDRTCPNCKAGLEQFCDSGATFTYNSPDPHTGGMTYGGYSKSVVVDQDFVLRLSDKLDLASSAPLLCAGITTWSPLRKWKVGKGQKVGVPRRQLAGSLIGGIAETQEMLDFCADRGIACDIELIKIEQINEAYERMLKSDVKYRFVIDMASLV